MTQTINPLAVHISQIARGLVDMDKRAGTFPAMREDTLHGAVFWNTLIPTMTAMPNIGTLQLTYKPSKRGCMTTITTVNGDVRRIYRDTGHGEYDECDCCNALTDIAYLNASNICDECEDRELDEDEHQLMDDTPCLDTSFHDY